jgi:hypothetical protein
MMKFKLGSWPKYPTTDRRGLERLTVKLLNLSDQMQRIGESDMGLLSVELARRYQAIVDDMHQLVADLSRRG